MALALADAVGMLWCWLWSLALAQTDSDVLHEALQASEQYDVPPGGRIGDL